MLSGSLCCLRPAAIQIAEVLPDTVGLNLLALGDELAHFPEVELEEKVELVADGATEIEFGGRLRVVEVARGDREELLGTKALLLSLFVASLGFEAEVGHLDILCYLAVPF